VLQLLKFGNYFWTHGYPHLGLLKPVSWPGLTLPRRATSRYKRKFNLLDTPDGLGPRLSLRRAETGNEVEN
jgi:hypothetical protein